MRKLLMIVLGLTIVSFVATDAWAIKISDIKKVSRGSLQSTCAQMGGTFSSNGSIYSCEKKNCDGKGGSCEVLCSDKESTCTGITPLKHRPILASGIAGIQQILTASPGKPPKPGTSAATGRGPLGGGLLETGGSGLGAGGPAATGSPASSAGAAPRPQGGGGLK